MIKLKEVFGMRILTLRSLMSPHPMDITVYPCVESRLIEIRRYFKKNTCNLETIDDFRYLKWLEKEYLNNKIDPIFDIFDETNVRRYENEQETTKNRT